ncbi:MAG TPA: hypothetical protein VN089_03275 [Duganella sp.]|nr:hypothetical protein [Duganella sp.]
MLSSYPFWWFALPVLLLPIWWHRQKRQRLKAEPLATARFLPVAAPEQLRVWQWRDRVLLLVRCLLLIVLIAWLAATILPWRGDTVLLDAGADKAWAEREIGRSGFADAPRIDLPPDAFQWLRRHERDWRPDARLLIVARAENIAMPARLPRFGHAVELRTIPGAASVAAPRTLGYQVALAVPSGREAAWRSMFAAFDRAGGGAIRYVTAAEPNADTKLIVWDTPGAAPPAGWRASDWWIAPASGTRAAFPELEKAATLTINGVLLKYADSPRGRLWTSDAFPPRDADAARALYEAWQSLGTAPVPAYPTASQALAAARASSSAIIDAKPAAWLGYALLALFLLERILAHARRN